MGMTMDNDEARLLLRQHLTGYRSRSYAELAAAIGEVAVVELKGPSGAIYQIEVDIRWDKKPRSNVHVFGAIDDGGLRAFMPLCDDFIMAPDGSFLGE
jgi:hypothetical protein